MILAGSLIAWAQAGKPEGSLKEHIWTRARAIGADDLLPPDFKSYKLAFGTRLRKN